jgi:nucleoside-diphosphate-sugar epimerase
LIYGNGLIASAFREKSYQNNRYIIFASGVSNSSENRSSEFLREKNNLLACIDSGHSPVYFSTCSIYDLSLKNSSYVQHKLEMESICKRAESFLIFRLPQVVGVSSNPNTITNYLFNKISTYSKFELWTNVSRVLIDVEDVVLVVNYVIENNLIEKSIINVGHEYPISALEIVEIFESILKVKANYDLVNKGMVYSINTKFISNITKLVGIKFDSEYSKKLLYKYYVS